MSTWITVTRVYDGPHGKPTELEVRVNADLVAAIVPRTNGSTLIWHNTSPRTEWRVRETPGQILREVYGT